MDNSKFKIQNLKLFDRGFTLVELLIVVSILGILAAIVLPEFSGHVQQAKESAAKDNLRILREAIERYAFDHNGVAPGYGFNDPTNTPTGFETEVFLTNGYLNEIPDNPFNDLNTIDALENSSNLPASADGTTGWIYKPATKEIRLNYSGTDSEGNAYYSY